MEIQLVPTAFYTFASFNIQQQYYLFSNCFAAQEGAQGSYAALCHIGTAQHNMFWTICNSDFLLTDMVGKFIHGLQGGGNTSLLEKKQRFSSTLEIVSLLHDLSWVGEGSMVLLR